MQALLVTFSDSTNGEKTEVKKERKKEKERTKNVGLDPGRKDAAVL